MSSDPVLERLYTACDAAGAACCKSGSIFLTPAEHDAIARHCAAQAEPALAETFGQRASLHDGFGMLDQGEGCMFLDARNRCTLHDLGIKPRECHWWPLHAYRESDAGTRRMAVCVADYCCAGVGSVGDARNMAARYADEIPAALPALRRFRAVFPGSAPRRHAMWIEDEG
jgi:Fe-S-cluster containining protein